ncbi:T9SS type A sorting domain-containing protein, partial [Flavobacteriaceae bacterium 14752]|uniref:T9SS type A sorting domain-containing protein n=1 Tax=Mesohalobacter salilacus TaxID=2491711 RepID=UPI000FB72703
DRFDIRFDTTTLSNDDFELSGISIYPNPANDVLNINLGQNSSQIENFTLFDLNGRQIYQKQFEDNQTQENQIDVSQLSSGVYLLTVKTQNTQYNQKVIIE